MSTSAKFSAKRVLQAIEAALQENDLDMKQDGNPNAMPLYKAQERRGKLAELMTFVQAADNAGPVGPGLNAVTLGYDHVLLIASFLK